LRFETSPSISTGAPDALVGALAATDDDSLLEAVPASAAYDC
jgi:hypothetical protein